MNYSKHPRAADLAFLWDLVRIIVMVCAFGWLLSWLSEP